MSRSVDLWQDSTCPNRKNSRIGKSAISRKQPLLFSGKQWETSSLGRATRRSVNLAQVGVDNHATDLTKRWRQRRPICLQDRSSFNSRWTAAPASLLLGADRQA